MTHNQISDWNWIVVKNIAYSCFLVNVGPVENTFTAGTVTDCPTDDDRETATGFTSDDDVPMPLA